MLKNTGCAFVASLDLILKGFLIEHIYLFNLHTFEFDLSE